MKILVYPHDLGIGGSQLNAIDLAAAVSQLGHETVIFGRPGPLVDRVRELGLEFIEAPVGRRRPSPAVIGALRRVVESRRIDLLHGYEWPPALECYLAAKLARPAVAMATVMSMSVAPFIPKTMPLLVGTAQIAAVERQAGRHEVRLMEPPVDLQENNVDSRVDHQGFRERWSLSEDIPTAVIVSRLAHELKLEGVLAAIRAVEELQDEVPLQLVIVGSGPASTEVAKWARRTNARIGQNRIILTGQLDDPRPAYASADVVLGMGGSALRALAFGKPLIVQGERGFWQLLTHESLSTFLWQGWYGVGQNSAEGVGQLVRTLKAVLSDAQLRTDLQELAIRVVTSRYDLRSAADQQRDYYQGAIQTEQRASSNVTAEISALARYVSYQTMRRLSSLSGRMGLEDFNSAPVAASASRMKAFR